MKKGLKDIMKEIIAERTKQDVRAILKAIEAEHEVSVFSGVAKNMKLTYDEGACCWQYKMEILIIVDGYHKYIKVEGLLHDTGNTSIMWIRDGYDDRLIWKLFDRDGNADENRQIEYDRLIEAA